jgi:RNA-directed RNA polymerase
MVDFRTDLRDEIAEYKRIETNWLKAQNEIYSDYVDRGDYYIDGNESLHPDSNVFTRLRDSPGIYLVKKRREKGDDAIILGRLIIQGNPVKQRAPLKNDKLNEILNYTDNDIDYNNRVWYGVFKLIDNYLIDGGSLPVVEDCIYDQAFEHNVIVDAEAAKLKHRALVTLNTYMVEENDSGISSPTYLRAWRRSSIPDSVMLNGTAFPMSTACFKRINNEANFFFFCNIFRYVEREMDLTDESWRLWVAYVVQHGDWFNMRNNNVHDCSSLLAHKRLECVIMYNDRKNVCNWGVAERQAALQHLKFVLVDPIYRTKQLKDYYGDMNQYAFARSQTNDLRWTNMGMDLSDTYLKKELDVIDDRSGFNLVEDSVIERARVALTDLGVPAVFKIMNDIIYADVNKNNLRMSKFNRHLLSFVGFSGTHPISSAVSQFEDARYKYPDTIDPVLHKAISDKFFTLLKAADKGNSGTYLTRMQRLYKGGTSSSSSAMKHIKTSIEVSSRSRLLTADKLRSIFNISDSKVVQKNNIRLKLNKKTANIITDPAEFYTYNKDIYTRAINSGSRKVRGIRAVRIITPDDPSMYTARLYAELDLVRAMARHQSLIPATGIWEVSGSSFSDALAHKVLSSQIASTSGNTSYFCIAIDYSGFDQLQFGKIAEAKADGIRKYALTRSVENDSVDLSANVDLRYATESTVLNLVSESTASEHFYKIGDDIVRAGAVRSGQIDTTGSNHVTNDASSDVYIKAYNALHAIKIKLVSKNVVGDDLVMVCKRCDGMPLDQKVAEDIKQVIIDFSSKFHLTISPKRMVIGNNTTEHIKMFVHKGRVMQDVMLTWKNGERDTFRKNNFMERVNFLYDMVTTMGSRFTDLDYLIAEMFKDFNYIDGLNRGVFTFLPTPLVFMGGGGPEVLLRAFELRNFARRLRIVDNELFYTISKLCATMLSGRGKADFINTVKKQLILQAQTGKLGRNSIVSKIWVDFFARRNDINPDDFKYKAAFKKIDTLKEFTPEGIEDYLLNRILSTVNDDLINIVNGGWMIEMILLNLLSKPDTMFPEIEWVFEGRDRLDDMNITCYAAADVGMRMVHSDLGMSTVNIRIKEAVSAVDSVLKSLEDTVPLAINGEDVLKMCQAAPKGMVNEVLELLGFPRLIAESLGRRIPRLLAKYELEGKSSSFTYYDSMSRTYDSSDLAIDSCVRFIETVDTKVRTRSYEIARLYGYATVIYYSRRGQRITVRPTSSMSELRE